MKELIRASSGTLDSKLLLGRYMSYATGQFACKRRSPRKHMGEYVDIARWPLMVEKKGKKGAGGLKQSGLYLSVGCSSTAKLFVHASDWCCLKLQMTVTKSMPPASKAISP